MPICFFLFIRFNGLVGIAVVVQFYCRRGWRVRRTKHSAFCRWLASSNSAKTASLKRPRPCAGGLHRNALGRPASVLGRRMRQKQRTPALIWPPATAPNPDTESDAVRRFALSIFLFAFSAPASSAQSCLEHCSPRAQTPFECAHPNSPKSSKPCRR